MKIHELITKRWSPRAFSTKAVEEEKINALMEAARWAPSSMNEQPWRFIFAFKEDRDDWQRLFDTLNPHNQAWAVKAPVLMAVVAKRNFTYKDYPNNYAWYDTGQAVGNMLFQATALGLHAHQMGGFSPEEAKVKLHIPEDHDPVAMMALGYLGDPNDLPDKLKDREVAPRVRLEIHEIAFKGSWPVGDE